MDPQGNAADGDQADEKQAGQPVETDTRPLENPADVQQPVVTDSRSPESTADVRKPAELDNQPPESSADIQQLVVAEARATDSSANGQQLVVANTRPQESSADTQQPQSEKTEVFEPDKQDKSDKPSNVVPAPIPQEPLPKTESQPRAAATTTKPKPARTRRRADEDGTTTHHRRGRRQPQPPVEEDALRLLTSGSGKILVDIVAIRDYGETESEAWTFTVAHLKDQLLSKKFKAAPYNQQSKPVPSQSADDENQPSSSVRASENVREDERIIPKEPKAKDGEAGTPQGNDDAAGKGRRSSEVQKDSTEPQPFELMVSGALQHLLPQSNVGESAERSINPQPADVRIRERRKSSTSKPLGAGLKPQGVYADPALQHPVTSVAEEGQDPIPYAQVNWLQHPEMLPQQISGARVLSFDYRTYGELNVNPVSLQTLVKFLQEELQKFRQADRLRPIVFIVHDFGFALLAELLMADYVPSAFRLQLQKALAATYVFISPQKGNLDDLKGTDYAKHLSERVLAGIDKLPYTEARQNDFSKQHMKYVRSIRNLSFKHSPRAFLKFIISDGKQFKEPTDPIFMEFAKGLVSNIRARHLIQATLAGKDDQLRIFKEEGWDLNLSDGVGRRALHFSILSNKLNVLRYLVNCFDVDVDSKDTSGLTALYYAISTLSSPQSAIATLVDKGADPTIKDKTGLSILDIATQRGINQNSLLTSRAVTGPSRNPDVVLKLPNRDVLGDLKQLAAEDCLMTMAEFFDVEDQGVRTEKFVMQRSSIYEVLYGTFPDDLLQIARGSPDMNEDSKVCRWFHIPHNHTEWVDGLFARLGLARESIKVDQHDGTTTWGSYLRPHARSFKAEDHPIPSQYKKSAPKRNQNGATAPAITEVNGTLIYMPFLTCERHCDQKILHNTLTDKNLASSRLQPYLLGARHAAAPEPAIEVSNIDRVELGNPTNTQDEPSGNATTAPMSPDPQPPEDDVVVIEEDSDDWQARRATRRAERSQRQRTQRNERISKAESNAQRLRSERGLLFAYKDALGRPLHVRRTLDQSHYLMLANTSKRDRDQVVLRRQQGRQSPLAHRSRAIYFRHHTEPSSGPDSDIEDSDAEDLKDENLMVMVDQLWLWVIDDKTVISSFPHSWPRADWQHQCDVLRRITDYINAIHQRGPIRSGTDLAKLIIKHCTDVFNHAEGLKHKHSLSLHDEFETSAGIVADGEMKLFRRFADQVFQLSEIEVLEQATELKDDSFSYYDDTSDSDDTSKAEIFQNRRHLRKKKRGKTLLTENQLLDRLFDIKKEIELLDEAKDVQDELRMILRILHEQEKCIDDFVDILSPKAKLLSKSSTNLHHGRHASAGSLLGSPVADKYPESSNGVDSLESTVVDDTRVIVRSNLKDFRRMLEHVTATENGINHLLELKQKEANALEARFSRKSAEAATKQQNTILFFTIVTIVFGSLSFITAFFALNVSAFPQSWHLGNVVGMIIGLSLGLSIPFIVVALTVNSIMEKFSFTGIMKGIVEILTYMMLIPIVFLIAVASMIRHPSRIVALFNSVMLLFGLRRRRRRPESSYYTSSYYSDYTYMTSRMSSDRRTQRGSRSRSPQPKKGIAAMFGKLIPTGNIFGRRSRSGSPSTIIERRSRSRSRLRSRSRSRGGWFNRHFRSHPVEVVEEVYEERATPHRTWFGARRDTSEIYEERVTPHRNWFGTPRDRTEVIRRRPTRRDTDRRRHVVEERIQERGTKSTPWWSWNRKPSVDSRRRSRRRPEVVVVEERVRRRGDDSAGWWNRRRQPSVDSRRRARPSRIIVEERVRRRYDDGDDEKTPWWSWRRRPSVPSRRGSRRWSRSRSPVGDRTHRPGWAAAAGGFLGRFVPSFARNRATADVSSSYYSSYYSYDTSSDRRTRSRSRSIRRSSRR